MRISIGWVIDPRIEQGTKQSFSETDGYGGQTHPVVVAAASASAYMGMFY